MQEIEQIAFLARRVLQASLLQCMNKENTKGACLYGAHLVHTMVSQFSNYHSVVRGGDGMRDGGFYKSGMGHGHYWVEVSHPTGQVIVDITGDQFGLEPILIMFKSEAIYYCAGNQDVVDEHYGRFMLEIGKHVPGDFT